MTTEKLYYADSYLHEFTAKVLECRKLEGDGGFAVLLDKTAFFPEGGGMPADTGRIGNAKVTDVQEVKGEILHYTDTELHTGDICSCTLDYEQRLRHMQNHSGEHIFSGIAHTLYGVDNVGFHTGADFMTIDFNKELTWDELSNIEYRANEAVRANLNVRAWYPEPEELAGMEYRSKLELTENVRIVEIEGIDRCACCAVHVTHTGEIGMIKLLESERHRGGVRLTLVCGMDALDAVKIMQGSVVGVSKQLSAKRAEIESAVERVLAQEQRYKERIAQLSMMNIRLIAAGFEPREGSICVFDDGTLDEIALRELVNLLCEKCTGAAAVFSGSDESGYKYIIGSRHIDLRRRTKEINSAIDGRGGGSSEMIQGRSTGKREKVQEFVETALV